ncbi:MAG: hypothetical protein JJ899_10275, partial [Alphaproteobacteria bacterium]|nr:hypothetical protein [Alphaproteobacteria bacterium]
MLEDQLRKASRDASRRSAMTLVGITALVLLLGAFAIGAATFWPKAAEEPEGPVAVREDSTPVATSPGRSVHEPDAQAGELPAGGNTDSAAPDPVREELRARFKTELAAFQEEIEPRVADPAFATWDAGAQHDILAGKNEAIDLFAQGRYGEAVSGLATARDVAETQIDARDRAFDDAFVDARQAYASDDVDSANLAISRARELKPDDPATVELAERIEQLPPVLAAIADAAVARTENDLHREADALARVLDLDPSRTVQATRLAEVQEMLREQAFATHVRDGFQAIEAGNVAAGRRSLAAARKLYRGRSETRSLSTRIEELARDQEFRRLVANAEKARASDDWETAESLYARAGAIEPDDPRVNGGYALAGDILALRAQVASYLASPERLSSKQVAQQARGTVSRVADIAELSPSLAQRGRELESLVAAYDREVAVRILSDGVTHISVRGVGHVGATNDRTIELRPGSYTFEGKRPGYRSKLVQVDIPPGADT